MPPVTHAPPLQIAVSPTRVAVGRALRHGSFWVGGLIILVIFLAAIFAPWLTPHDPSIQDLGQRFVAPVWAEGGSWAHPLGTDGLGRDYLTRLLFGARISLMIGFLTILISGTIGTAMGVAAGYWGGWVDLVVNFIITIRLTLPVVLVALVVVALVGSSLSLLVMVIGLLLWDRFAIVMRSATQQLASREYITSARTIGSSTTRILIREILPNIMGPLIVVASIELAHAILLEAALSFLGLGVQPPNVSWGLMVAEAKSQLLFRPWMIAVPGAALVLLIFAINLVGDALRDVTTPEGKA
ncbi:permease protein, ABC-type oligopeptide transporter [Aurantimonas manganoxydans SI85-9A1]|uniref:Permease protein, ABC-type oligopeptide transporter n=1 Tax=Aurantimonas manganoxydans (strain ATCC BAA-1229 / DSM 21871 / SI85-9A1) TaxID=287752 RepID=Q1YLC8_AURMS|nr:ABC transporter permease [Aurantimonas manganoxydans]EAS51803.1 permease protein, ABC-type oligopeptide transporter [Aurantimonas manganoxydans SI85-9A1]